jgi:uncharacterized protein (TIRG00374 family)
MTEKKAMGLFAPSRIVFYILSILVFYLAVHYVGKLEDIKTLLLEMSPGWLFLAVACQMATYLFNALILYVLLDKKTGNASFFTLFKISIVTIFINQALPSGGLSGNGYVFNQLLKRKVEVSRAFRVLILESICYYIAMVLLLIFFYSWYRNSTVSINLIITYTVIGGCVFFIFLGMIMLAISNKRTVSFILNKFGRFGSIKRYMDKVSLSSLDKKSISLKFLLQKQKNSVLAIFFQLCLISCDIITAFAIIKGFHVLLPFNHVAFALLLSIVIGALPISPGSLITYEGAMTYFLTIFGSAIHAALIVTLLFRFLTFWLPMPIGLVLYKNLQKKSTTGYSTDLLDNYL